MLDEISGSLEVKKHNEFASRLLHTDTNTALAAEGELAVLWAINRVADMEPEPVLPHSKHRPDAWSANLFASGPTVIEVRALSDAQFSGKEAMDRTANIVANYADRIRKGAGSYLYFEFSERSYYTTRFHRERCVDPHFELSADIENLLSDWISAKDWPNPERVRITQGASDFVVSWKPSTVRYFRTFCTMPPVAYDLEDNPIYKALKKKAKQVRGAGEDTLKCIVLVDAGCDLLRRLRPISAVHEIGGETIIRHTLQKLNIDSVIALSPYREPPMVFGQGRPLHWKISCFDRRDIDLDADYERIKKLAAELPAPRYEGYQARDIHKQGGFSLARRRHYVPTHTTTHGAGAMTIRISAGLLHKYLAGKIDDETFQRETFHKDQNFFESELTRGNSITNVRFESGGIDEDDDYVIFDLDTNWSRIEIRAPKKATKD